MSDTADLKTKRFHRGMLLAWIPIVLVLTPLIIELVKVASIGRATGVGAVAGGFAEVLTLFGVLALVAFQAAAIVLLSRSFTGGQPIRSISAALSIFCSAMMLAVVALALWMLVRLRS